MTLVDVATVNPGDLLLVHPRIGRHMVGARLEYDDGSIVLTYFHRGESVFENKARDKSGPGVADRLVERQIVPKRAGDLVDVERGDERAARDRRAEMEAEQIERNELAEDRARRAAARDRGRP